MTAREAAIQCLKIESAALLNLIPEINDNYVNAIELIYNCKGKLIVTGVGKSGHIGAKIASTLASTGTPSFYVNPLDAFHGDLGMVSKDDIVLAISHSGQTEELLRFIPYLVKRHIPIIGMSGNPHSLLAKYSFIHINAGVDTEADPLNLAPTSSTTAQLAMGDAIASALIQMRGFTQSDYAEYHPGGSLGKRLLMKVSDVMLTEDLPIVNPECLIIDILPIMSKSRLGLVVAAENNKVLGIFTSGDFRNGIQSDRAGFLDKKISEKITMNPITIKADASLMEAMKIFKEKKMVILIVLDSNEKLAGILKIQDCEV